MREACRIILRLSALLLRIAVGIAVSDDVRGGEHDLGVQTEWPPIAVPGFFCRQSYLSTGEQNTWRCGLIEVSLARSGKLLFRMHIPYIFELPLCYLKLSKVEEENGHKN